MTSAVSEGGEIRYSLVDYDQWSGGLDTNEHFRPSAAGLSVKTAWSEGEGNSLVVTRNGESYPVTELGGYYVGVNAWNSRGQMVGYDSIDPTPEYKMKSRPILIENGITRDIGIPGYNYLQANAINEKGQVVGGTNGGPRSTPGAFFFDGQTTKMIGPSYRESTATDINESGVIVGKMESIGNGRPTTGFVYIDGYIRDLNSITDGRQGLHIYEAMAIRDDNWIQVSALNLTNGQPSHHWLKPEFVMQTISDDAATPDDPTGDTGSKPDTGEITLPGAPDPEQPGAPVTPPVTVVDTETGDWNKPTIDLGTGESGSADTSGSLPDPVPVPEPMTWLIWALSAAFVAARSFINRPGDVSTV